MKQYARKARKFPKDVLIGFWKRSFVKYVSHELQALKYKTHAKTKMAGKDCVRWFLKKLNLNTKLVP